jgi:peroxiredoxin
MAKTESNMLELGTNAPDFALPTSDGLKLSLEQCLGPKGTVVMFICNHCPYVVHIAPQLGTLAQNYQQQGIGFVAINSNDIENYPEDAPDKMKLFAKEHGLDFPYLLDQSQQVAHAYQAACTPDFYVFDHHRTLVYRGQFDDARPGSSVPVSGSDLAWALDSLLTQKPISPQQQPSLGCNIKWRQGNEPEYFKRS